MVFTKRRTEGKGLTPLRTQGSPLRSDPLLRYRSEVDKPLTSFTPVFKTSNYRAFSESPLFSFFFCLLPRHPRHGLPELPLCFFAWLAHVPPELAERIRSSPARREEGTRRAWGLRESAESATLSTCQQSKKGLVRLSGSSDKL